MFEDKTSMSDNIYYVNLTQTPPGLHNIANFQGSSDTAVTEVRSDWMRGS